MKCPIRLKTRRPTNNRRLIALKIFLPCSSARRIRAHQNPPSPDARITYPLAEEDPGVRLNMQLTTMRNVRISDINMSGDFQRIVFRGAASKVTSKVDAQRIPENTFALSSGMIPTNGNRKARCADVQRKATHASFHPQETSDLRVINASRRPEVMGFP